MFETEIKETRNKLAKSLRLWRKAEKLEKEIRNTDNIFYLYLRNDCKCDLYKQATNVINNLIGCKIGNNFALFYANNKKEFEKNSPKVQQITKNDVLKALKESVNSEYNTRYGLAPEINKDTITIGLSNFIKTNCKSI